MIINKKSEIGKQTVKIGTERKESGWSKANVIIALVVGIAIIIGVIWQIFR